MSTDRKFIPARERWAEIMTPKDHQRAIDRLTKKRQNLYLQGGTMTQDEEARWSSEMHWNAEQYLLKTGELPDLVGPYLK